MTLQWINDELYLSFSLFPCNCWADRLAYFRIHDETFFFFAIFEPLLRCRMFSASNYPRGTGPLFYGFSLHYFLELADIAA